MTEKFNISLIITIVTILLSVGGSFAVVQSKVSNLEKATEKSEKTLEEMKDFRAEQRVKQEYVKEKLDKNERTMEEILKEIRALK